MLWCVCLRLFGLVSSMIGWFALWKNPILCKNREVMENTWGGNLNIEVDGSDDLSGFQFGWFLGEPNVNFQAFNMSCEATHLEANLVRLNAAMSACQMLGISVSAGVEPWRLNFGAGNVWTAYSVKADCLGISATSRAWNFRNCPGWLQVISSFLFCCFFVPFFFHAHTFSFRPLEQKKKVRWNLSLFGLSTLSEINSNIC